MSLRLCGLLTRSQRSPDERSDIRDRRSEPAAPACRCAHAGYLLEASVARMSEAISGTGFPNVPHPHVAALMRATYSFLQEGPMHNNISFKGVVIGAVIDV